jgi:hypothetical protein
VVELFVAYPGADSPALDGVMLDIPNLKQARKTLGLTWPGTNPGRGHGLDQLRLSIGRKSTAFGPW